MNQLQLSSSAVADEAGQKKTTCGTSRQVKSNADDLHADEFKLHSDMRNNECKQQGPRQPRKPPLYLEPARNKQMQLSPQKRNSAEFDPSTFYKSAPPMWVGSIGACVQIQSSSHAIKVMSVERQFPLLSIGILGFKIEAHTDPKKKDFRLKSSCRP